MLSNKAKYVCHRNHRLDKESNVIYIMRKVMIAFKRISVEEAITSNHLLEFD